MKKIGGDAIVKGLKTILLFVLVLVALPLIGNFGGTVDPAHATVTVETARIQYNCNGVTTAYTYPFEILEDDDLLAIKASSSGVETTLVLNTDYTVAGAGSTTGGTVTLTAASTCASGYTLTLLRNIELTQETDYVDGEAFSAESLENAIDRTMLIQQQQQEELDRSLRVQKSSTLTDLTVTPTAGKAIGFNSAGTGLTTYDTTSVTSNDFVNITDYGATVSAALTAIGATEVSVVVDTAISIGANVTPGANVHFIFLKGGCIDTTGYTFDASSTTINAGVMQIFSGTGTVTGLKAAYPEWWGPNTTPGTTNMTAEIQAAVTAVTAKNGTVYFQPELYLASSPILVEGILGIKLQGQLGTPGAAGTRIKGAHTGKAIVSLVGSMFVSWENIQLEGDSTSKPKTGLLVGRSSAASAGYHTFKGLNIYGYFTIAGYYNVASESNTHKNTYIYCEEAPKAAVSISQDDLDTIGGLTGSSMEHEHWIGGTIANADTTADSAALRIHAGGSTGHIVFDKTMVAKQGAGGVTEDCYVELLIDTDGLPTTMPITLNIFGEAITTSPMYGFRLRTQSAAQQYISGFTAENIRFSNGANSGVGGYIFYDGGGANGIQFVGAKISTSYWAPGAGSHPSTFNRFDNSIVHLFGESAVTILTANNNDMSLLTLPTITTNLDNKITMPHHTVMSGGFSEPLISVSTVSFAADGATALYTVPFGRRFVPTKVVVVAGADAGATTTMALSGPTVPNDFLGPSTLSNLDAQYDAVILMPVPNATPAKIKSYQAADIFYATVGAHSGGATNTVFVFGILY